MPLRKSASKKEDSAERLRRYHARKAAEKKFGKAALKGKQVHHKNENNTDNRGSNLELKTPKAHGKDHGRGNGFRGKHNGKGPKKK